MAPIGALDLGASRLRARRPTLSRIDIGALKQDVVEQAESVLSPMPLTALARGPRDVEREFSLLDDVLVGRRQGFEPRRSRWNPSKDLCQDVLPYVEHRAQTLDGGYVNASLMPRTFGRQFIAAQGPLKGTVADFWSMVAHHRVRQIVALCGDDECAEYLPSEGRPLELLGGALELAWKGEEAVPGSESLRRCRLELRHGEDRWEVTRLHYSAWSDQGTVAPEALLRLVELAAGAEAEADAPTLVHCRAGAGRTGCFIALCGLVAGARRQLKEGAAGHLSVPQAVVDLRSHRPHMVQTAEQYRLLYEAMAVFLAAAASEGEPPKACPCPQDGSDKPQEMSQNPGAAPAACPCRVVEPTLAPPVLLRPLAGAVSKRNSLWERRFGPKDAELCVQGAEARRPDACEIRKPAVERLNVEPGKRCQEPAGFQEPKDDIIEAPRLAEPTKRPTTDTCGPSHVQKAGAKQLVTGACGLGRLEKQLWTDTCDLSHFERASMKQLSMDASDLSTFEKVGAKQLPTDTCDLSHFQRASMKQLSMDASDLSAFEKVGAEQLPLHMVAVACTAVWAGLFLDYRRALQLSVLLEAER